MTMSMYAASVPVFKQMLGSLSALLDKAEAHATEKKIDADALLQARLFPDMFPLTRQILIAADFAKGSCARLAGMEVPKYNDTERTFTELKARLQKTIAFIESIDAASIDTGLAKLEEHLRADDFFDVKRYPTLQFSGDKFRFVEDRLVAVSGNLSLHGVTLPVTLNVTRYKCGLNVARLRKVCGADLSTTIKRSEYGMSKGTPFVGDEVRVTIQVEAVRD